MNFEDNARLFLEEARELLAGLEKGFLELEEHPEREELVHDIFRSLHTIKGSGGMFGFDSVSEFTHDVENLFDDVRKGIVAVDARVTGIGLRAVDCIADLIDDPEPGGEAAAIRAEIAAIRGQGCQPARAEVALRPLAAPAEAATGAAPSSRPGSTAPGEASGRGLPHVYRIVFAPIEAILHRGVKLELLFQELGELGACHATCDWEGLPRLEDLDPSMIHLS